MIFVAELPDKTAFATLLLATRSRPLPVFLGVATAFLVQTAVALFLGGLFSYLPAHLVHVAAALLFFYFAWSMWRSRDEDTEAEGEDEIGIRRINKNSFPAIAWSAFLVIFIAEWGDTTQIMTAGLAAKYPADLPTVFVAALLALWTVTAVAVLLGQNAHKSINPRALKTYASYLFVLIGLYFVFQAALEVVG